MNLHSAIYFFVVYDTFSILEKIRISKLTFTSFPERNHLQDKILFLTIQTNLLEYILGGNNESLLEKSHVFSVFYERGSQDG